jgi:putative tricarboxylic transport membrane protein
MQLSDRITGLVLASLGAVAAWHASKLPPIPGQQIGPAVFPTVIGVGLCICGLLIALRVGRSFEDAAEADLASHQDAPAEPMQGMFGLPVGLNALVPIILLVFYVLAVEKLGFIPVAAIIIGLAALVLRAPPRLALAMAILAPPAIHLVFYKLLRVPLPPGLLPMPW